MDKEKKVSFGDRVKFKGELLESHEVDGQVVTPRVTEISAEYIEVCEFDESGEIRRVDKYPAHHIERA